MNKIYKLFLKSKSEKLSLKKIAFGTMLLAGSAVQLNGQVSLYSFAQSNGAYSPLSTGATVLGTATGNTSTTNLNSNIYPVTLPFSFTFNGTNYSSLNISSNGFITFGTTAPSSTTTTPISTSTAYDGAISAFGRDICSFFDVSSTTGNISWEVVGTAPNREIVIQWANFRPTSVTAIDSVYSLSFQIKLKENTNTISVIYGSGAYLIGSTSYNSTAQIGLRGNSNTDYNNRKNSTSELFTASTQGTANSSTQAYHTTNATPGMFSNGLTYTWTPPSCYPPSDFVAGGFTTSSANLSWTPPTSSPNSSYDVYYSTSNTPPVATTTPTIPAITTASTPISGLSPSTTYYAWVRSICSPTDKSEWTPILSFNTACGALTGSYFEDFESYPGGGTSTTTPLPACWTNYGTANGPTIVNSASSASNVLNGSKSLYLWTSGTTRIANIALPPMSTLQSGLYKLKFVAKASVTAGGFLHIGYLDSTNTFVQLDAFSVPTTATIYPYSFNIPVLPNGVTQLIIKNPGTPANSLSIDDISYELQTLGTSETNNKANVIKIYPNPFSEKIILDKSELVKTAKVMDVSGKLIKTINNPESTISLQDLTQGVYILNLEMKDGSKQSSKIIKK